MSRKIEQFKVGLDEDLSEKLAWMFPDYGSYRVTRKSVDARRSSDPHWVYSLEVFDAGETPPNPDYAIEAITPPLGSLKPIIIGTGPAGLFAAVRLAERGIPCIIFERGSEGPKRINAINRFWRYGELDPNNNVCFGEGGAGLYSDGKLITRIKSPYIPYVMHRLVQFGAPEEIKYLANPHVGSDRIRRVIPQIREFLRSRGCEIHFDTPIAGLLYSGRQVVGVRTQDGREFKSDHVVLATGHSADEVFDHLHENGVHMEGKSFAVGLRIEHPQKLINQMQFRKHADRPELGAANYKIADHDDKTGVGVYSFCMCPGGYVLSSGTRPESVVCNGMSNYNRNSPFANSAIVVSVDHAKHFGDKLFGGLEFRNQLESRAYGAVVAAGGHQQIPAQRVIDFIMKKSGPVGKTSSPSGVLATRLDQILPDWMHTYLSQSLGKFESHMRGFISNEALFHGVESRTSCPIRVTRTDDTLESITHQGLYPCGEGAGYAGGITSAACDGIRVAESIVTQMVSQSVSMSAEKNG